MKNECAIFICTHGRPNNQLTLQALLNSGYTGKWYLILDDTDNTIQEYIDNYPVENIIIFNKNHYINSDMYDNGDVGLHEKCILYAKRAVEDIAKYLGYTYFVIADDDIIKFNFRYPENSKLRRARVTDLDSVFDAYIELLSCHSIAGLGFGYPKTYFPGVNTFSPKNLCIRYMPYQFILRNGNVRVDWVSWMAEDDISELQSGLVGNAWLVLPYVMQDEMPIANASGNGGMVDTYKNFSAYRLAFNAVRYCPNRVTIRYKDFAIVKRYDSCFPKIVSGGYKK